MKAQLIALATTLTLTFPLHSTAGGAGAEVEEGLISFQKDLMPTLKRRCAACHITGDEPGKMALIPGKAYEFIVNINSVGVPALKRIKPNSPDESYLIHKIQGTHLDVGGNGVRMPFHQGPLSKQLVGKFRTWVEQGAQNN